MTSETELAGPTSAEKTNGSSKSSEPIDIKAMFPMRRCLAEDGSLLVDPQIRKELLREMMTYMIWNREVDERLTRLQRQGRIGFYVGSVGEEAVMIGTAAALEPQDWVVPCYREAGVALYRGMSLDTLVQNVFGTALDVAKGRQMPCHWNDRERNILSVSSPVGTQIPQAVGIAWAMKLQKTNGVAIVYFGDGATSEGDFHYALNFAGVYQVPVVFVCRNNQWAISTPYRLQTKAETVAQKSIAYGIHGERVDGNDVLAVHQAAKEAVGRARSGQGPTLIEMYTYRQGAHSTSDDPRAYRAQEELEVWMKRDPITRTREHLSQVGLWTEKEEEELRQHIAQHVDAAIRRAERTSPPKVETMFQDVFKEQPEFLKAQQRDLEEALDSEGQSEN